MKIFNLFPLTVVQDSINIENKERDKLVNEILKMKNRNINLFGWILFVISAIGFTISSIGNFWAMFGSLFFLIACIVFLIPFFREEKNER